MDMTFLGTGGAFSRYRHNPHNNALLEDDQRDKTYLIDCSLHALEKIHEYGYEPTDIDGVIVTHIHADHVGGLEEVAFQNYFDPDTTKPTLFLPKALYSGVEGGESDGTCLWENCLKGGLLHLNEGGEAKSATLEDYFDLRFGPTFDLFNKEWAFIETDHVPGKQSFGLVFHAPYTLYTADAKPFENHKYYEKADRIFHDCMTVPRYKGTVHTHLEELEQLPERIQEKIHLMHHGETDESHDTISFVRPDQIFEF